MTRKDKLISMKMSDLVNVAKNLGIKINPKARKWDAVEKILAAEAETSKEESAKYVEASQELTKALNKDNSKSLEQMVNEQAEQNLVPMPGAEKLAELKQEIDPVIFAKFVKKAQRLITSVTRDGSGYHVTINVNGKNISYNDKCLQNIRSEIGKIYRGEVEV